MSTTNTKCHDHYLCACAEHDAKRRADVRNISNLMLENLEWNDRLRKAKAAYRNNCATIPAKRIPL